jgi:hypothetical protein
MTKVADNSPENVVVVQSKKGKKKLKKKGKALKQILPENVGDNVKQVKKAEADSDKAEKSSENVEAQEVKSSETGNKQECKKNSEEKQTGQTSGVVEDGDNTDKSTPENVKVQEVKSTETVNQGKPKKNRKRKAKGQKGEVVEAKKADVDNENTETNAKKTSTENGQVPDVKSSETGNPQKSKKNRKAKKKPKNKEINKTIESVVKEAKLEIQQTTSKADDNGEIKVIQEQPTKKDDGPDYSVFVGNLPPLIKPSKVKQLFMKFGEIKSIRFRTEDGSVIYQKKRLKKLKSVSCYVRFVNEDDSKKALEMHNTVVDDFHIRVNLANSKPKGHSKSTIFVGNISYSE